MQLGFIAPMHKNGLCHAIALAKVGGLLFWPTNDFKKWEYK